LRPEYNYFGLKIYEMIECNIAYIIVFFQHFLKYLCSNFVNFKKEKNNRLPGAPASFGVFGDVAWNC
jgi:hypothetical protein